MMAHTVTGRLSNLMDKIGRAGEAAIFLAAPAPDLFQAASAPDFFPKRLRLRSALAIFFERFRLQGAKNTRL